MPATSSVTNGDRPHAIASSAARITSASCSTGMVAASSCRRPRRSSSTPQARPSSNEPKITTLALASSVNESGADRTCECARTGHSLTARMASALLMALNISSRSATWPRGRASSKAAIVITGEVAAASAASRGGAGRRCAQRHQGEAHHHRCHRRLERAAGSQPRVVDQPARPQPRAQLEHQRRHGQVDQRLPGVDVSALQQAQHRRAGHRADQQVAEQPRQAQALVQRAGQHQGGQHHQRQAEHRVGAAQPGHWAPQQGDEPVGDLLGHCGRSAGGLAGPASCMAGGRSASQT